MATSNKIIKNFGVMFSAHLISKVIGFFSLVLTTRYLGVEKFGILSFAIAFAGICNVFFTLGLSPLITREISRNKAIAHQYLGNIITIKLILVIVISCLIFIILKVLGYSEIKTNVIYIIILSMVFTSFYEIFFSIFQAYEKMEYQAFAQVLSGILMLSGVCIAIKYNFSIIKFAFIYVYVNFLILIYSFIVCKKSFTSFVIEIDVNLIKNIFKMAIPFAISSIILTFYGRIDITMLSSVHGDKAVGYYSSAWKIVEIFTAIPAVYITAIFPVMSSYYISSLESLKNLYENSFRFLLIIVLFLQISITIFADCIIGLIYGKEFIYSVRALQILIWTLFPIFLNFLLGNLVAAINRQEITVLFSFICLILNIILNIILIPRYSYIGASISTLSTQVFLFFLLYIFLTKNKFIVSLIQSVVKPSIAGLLMGAVMIFLKQVNWIFAFFLGVVLYIITILSFKVITKKEISSVFKSLYGK